MSTFKFRSKTVEVDVDGIICHVDTSKEGAERMLEIGKKLQGVKDDDEAVVLLEDSIIELIGEDSFDEIMEKHNMDSVDMLDLMNHIKTVIVESRKPVEVPKPNRATRRAKK